MIMDSANKLMLLGLLLCAAPAPAQEVPAIPPAEASATSPLADAAMRREMDRVRALLISEQELDVNAPGRLGTPALHWVVRVGDIDTADWLLEAGADLDLPNLYGMRPVHVAIENGHRDMLRWLLEAGADPEGRDLAGEPPLFMAAAMGDVESMDLLLAHGAGVDTRDVAYGQTALMVAVREGQSAAIERLLEAGADVNSQTRVTETMPGKDREFLLPS